MMATKLWKGRIFGTNRFNKCFQLINSSRNVSSQHYDIIISGGGMVGAAMAAALGHKPLLAEHRILMLESGKPIISDKPALDYSSRVCALSPGTVKLLSGFGAWDNITNMRYKEVRHMQVWESCSCGILTFNREQLTENLAYIVENDIILSGIMTQLTGTNSTENISIRHNSRVKKYQLSNSKLNTGDQGQGHLSHIELEDGSLLSANLLIGADGFNSLLRRTAGFHTVRWEYNQFAVVATLKLSECTDNNTAWQRFLPNGPIAMLPLSEEYSCLIWTTTPEDAKNLLGLSEESFVDAVNHAFCHEDELDPIANYAGQVFDKLLSTVGLGGSTSQQLPPTIVGIGGKSRGMFPLGLCHSSQYVRPGMALVGDAAHRVHPLAGQGVNLGFGDVACLRDQIVKAIQNGQNLGDLPYLLQYETLRQRHVIPTMAAVDGLNRLYSNKFSPLVVLRSLGLQATNALTPIKDRMISHAAS